MKERDDGVSVPRWQLRGWLAPGAKRCVPLDRLPPHEARAWWAPAAHRALPPRPGCQPLGRQSSLAPCGWAQEQSSLVPCGWAPEHSSFHLPWGSELTLCIRTASSCHRADVAGSLRATVRLSSWIFIYLLCRPCRDWGAERGSPTTGEISAEGVRNSPSGKGFNFFMSADGTEGSEDLVLRDEEFLIWKMRTGSPTPPGSALLLVLSGMCREGVCLSCAGNTSPQT